MSVFLSSNRVFDFQAIYPDTMIKRRNKYTLLCLTNPIGWGVGILLLINKLFEHSILSLGRDILFGTEQERRQPRDIEKLTKLTQEMGGKELQLQSPDGRILEGMYIASSNISDQTQQKTVLLFTGSHKPYEYDAFPMVKAYIDHGYHVLCLNYGGFGKSLGNPNQLTLELDAETAFQYIRHTYPNTAIHAHGYSLGSYAASYLAKNYDLSNVVIDRGFSRISSVVQDRATQLYGKVMGYIFQGLVKYVCPLDNLNNIENISAKLLVAQGNEDSIMLLYHAELFRKRMPLTAKILHFKGNHFHNSDSLWFKNNPKFWSWMQNDSKI